MIPRRTVNRGIREQRGHRDEFGEQVIKHDIGLGNKTRLHCLAHAITWAVYCQRVHGRGSARVHPTGINDIRIDGSRVATSVHV